MYLVNGNKKFGTLEFFQVMTYSPPNGIMSSLMLHFTVSRTLRCWEFLNNKTCIMKRLSICKDFFSSFQHITFLTLPFSQIKANSENFNLSIEMPSKLIKSHFPSKSQFCSFHEIMMKICVETF